MELAAAGRTGRFGCFALLLLLFGGCTTGGGEGGFTADVVAVFVG
jgi:hypothetical protein